MTEAQTGSIARWRGTQGAFAKNVNNGWSMAVLDATTPTGPYGLEQSSHESMVEQYFEGAGLPNDQVSYATSHFTMAGGGPVGGPLTQSLHSITSILGRAVSGVPIVESFAWAKMTTAGDTDMEAVFWPALPADVISQALNFASRMGDASARASFVAALPGREHRPGAVVIHHTLSSFHASVVARVAYDAWLADDQTVGARHFDDQGVEFDWPPANP